MYSYNFVLEKNTVINLGDIKMLKITIAICLVFIACGANVLFLEHLVK